MSNETKRVCVTGASGFLGRHLVQQLIDIDGYEVVAFCRNPDKQLREMGAEIAQGSVLEPSELEYALEGCDAVFHLAGRVERLAERAHLLYELHVQGTLNVIAVAGRVGVDRMIYASTSGTVGVSREPELIRDTAHTAEHLCGRWPYYLSKIYAEKAVRTAVEQGEIDAVIMRPTLLLGPGDAKLSSTEEVYRFIDNGMRIVPPGGMSFVDVRDAAQAFRAALHKGRKGEAYLLGSINLTIRDFYDRLAKLTGKASPMLVASPAATRLGVRALWAINSKFQDPFELDPVTLSMANHYWYIDWRKAMRELDFAPRDPGETLYETVSWIRAHRESLRRGPAREEKKRSPWRAQPAPAATPQHSREEPADRWARRFGMAARTAANVAGKVAGQVRTAGKAARQSLHEYRKAGDTPPGTGQGDMGLEALLSGGLAAASAWNGDEPMVSSTSGWEPGSHASGTAQKGGPQELDTPRNDAQTDALKAEVLHRLADASPEELEAALWAFERSRDKH